MCCFENVGRLVFCQEDIQVSVDGTVRMVSRLMWIDDLASHLSGEICSKKSTHFSLTGGKNGFQRSSLKGIVAGKTYFNNVLRFSIQLPCKHFFENSQFVKKLQIVKVCSII